MDYSVIIPVYNCAGALRECVESFLAGLPESSEILLVDDGSTDGSGALCDALQAQYGPVRAIHQENRGASAARNRGLWEAKGTYILFADGDDRVDSACLQTALEAAVGAGNRLAVFGHREIYIHRQIPYRRDVFLPPGDGESLYGWYTSEALSPLWNKVFLRETMERKGLFLREDLNSYEDLEFVLRYLRHCDGLFGIPQPVYDHRQWEGENRAVKRMRRVSSLWEVLGPIQTALVGFEHGDRLLGRLFGILAREKLMGADRAAARRVCEEYAAWVAEHGEEVAESRFLRLVQRGQLPVLRLYLAGLALRHRLAVEVKTFLAGRKRA